MTFPSTGIFPDTGRFPSSGTVTRPVFPYFTVGGWSSSGIDAAGCRWVNGPYSGWDEPPPVKGGSTPRPNAPGSFPGPVYDDERVVTISGWVICPDRATRSAAKTALAQVAVALRAGANVIGHLDEGDYEVTAKRASGWLSAPFGPLGWKYSAVVTCDDPYKYGPPLTSPPTGLPSAGTTGLVFPLFDGTGFLEFGPPGATGQVTLSNTGTVETWPVFVITGPVSGGFTLTESDSGRRIVCPDDVPTGAVFTIDAGSGLADINGADRTADLTVAQWWSVGPGDASTVQFNTTGPPGQAGTFTATIRPAYE
jgi:tail protein